MVVPAEIAKALLKSVFSKFPFPSITMIILGPLTGFSVNLTSSPGT